MQVRYQAALRPEKENYSSGTGEPGATPQKMNLGQQLKDSTDLSPEEPEVYSRLGDAFIRRGLRCDLLQTISSTADREALIIEQFPNPTYQQYLMMLIITSIPASLDRLELGEFLLPVAQHVRFDGAQFTDLANGEVTLGRDVRQRRLGVIVAVHPLDNACRLAL